MLFLNLANILLAGLALASKETLPSLTSLKESTVEIGPYRDKLISEAVTFIKDQGYSFRLIIFAWKRRASLERLLKPILAINYYNIDVILNFYLDGGAHPAVIDMIESVSWPNGPIRFDYNIDQVGLEKVFTIDV